MCNLCVKVTTEETLFHILPNMETLSAVRINYLICFNVAWGWASLDVNLKLFNYFENFIHILYIQVGIKYTQNHGRDFD